MSTAGPKKIEQQGVLGFRSLRLIPRFDGSVLALAGKLRRCIASRKRSKLVFNYLRKRGFAETDLKKIYAPSGLDLHARSADEIALATLSEIVMLRRGGTAAHRRDALREVGSLALSA